MSSTTALLSNGSMPAVGSSKMRISAPWQRAKIRLYFLFMPKEYFENFKSCGREKRVISALYLSSSKFL